MISASRLTRRIGVAVKEEVRRERMRSIYRKYRDYTMILQEDYVDNLLIAQRMTPSAVCVIECGVWRGGMSAGLAELLGPHRRYFLFDSCR